MRKAKRDENRGRLTVLAVGLVLAIVRPSLAFPDETQERKTAVEFGVGPVFHTGQSFDTGFFYRGGVFTLVSPRIGVELLVTGNRVKMDKPPAGLNAGKLATTQLIISGQYRFARGKRIIPYAVFGVEFNFFRYWPDNEAEEPQHDVVDRLAPHFGAGLDWRLSGWLALDADLRYSIVKTWVEELPREGPIRDTDPDTVDKINLNALTLTLNLKFYF